jgi:hypothetical protein
MATRVPTRFASSVVATTSGTTDEPGRSTAPSVAPPAIGDAPLVTAPGGGESQCAVTVSGAVTADGTPDASGPQAFVYGGWLSDPAPDDEGAFAVNCFDSDFNIVGFTGSSGAEIPMEPATYELTAAGDPTVPIAAEVALLFDEGLWETTGGTLQILEFDDRHIRAVFSLTIQDGFDPARTAEVTGEFSHSR